MLRDGSLDDMDHLKNFMIGFTQGKASFDFVDVGHGKERADSKIRGREIHSFLLWGDEKLFMVDIDICWGFMSIALLTYSESYPILSRSVANISSLLELTRWHLRNHNCKKLLLGISHDAGYAPFLDEVVKHNDRSRVTIIEGPPTVSGDSNLTRHPQLPSPISHPILKPNPTHIQTTTRLTRTRSAN